MIAYSKNRSLGQQDYRREGWCRIGLAVDLFRGTGSATAAFRDHPEWNVFSVELNPDNDFDSEGIDIEDDIRNVTPDDLPDNVDFVWASPPCTCLSIARCWDYWDNTGNDDMVIPAQYDTVEAVELVYHSLWLIQEMNPDYWFMENPRGYMRKVMPQEPGQTESEIQRETITYCQYGHHLQKPTDLWGVHPESMEYRSCKGGSDCHSNEERGMGSGSYHVRDPVERSKVPRGLSETILDAIENPEKKREPQTTLA